MITRKLTLTTFFLAAAMGMLPANGEPPAAKATPKAKPAVVAPAGGTSLPIGPDATGSPGTRVAPIETEADTDKIIARFFSYLQRKEVDQAFDQLTRGTRLAEMAEKVKTMKSMTKDAIEVLGPIVGYEFVSKKSVGTRLMRYTVISLGKRLPLRWHFYFYKPEDTWKLIEILPENMLVPIFGEAEPSRAGDAQP